MKIIRRFLFLGLVGGLGFWLWTVLFPGPQKIVLKKIASLAATATISANDSNLTRAGKAVKLAGFFATNAEVVIHIPDLANRTVSGREEIKESAMGGFATLTTLTVRFFDATATVGPDRQTAEVSCTAKVSTASNEDYGVQELRFQFQKIDGDWLIVRVETVPTLSGKRPGGVGFGNLMAGHSVRMNTL